MAQYRVPQSIFLPDRVIGPLTLPQFLYLFTAGAIDLALFFALPLPLFFLCALPTTALGLALAFVKINDQPFHKIMLAALAFYLKPRARTWRKLPPEEEIPIVKAPPPKKVPLPKRTTEEEMRSRLKSLALILDTQGWASIKEKRPEIAKVETVEVPGGIPKEAKPFVPPVAEEVALPTEIASAAIPAPAAKPAPLEMVPPPPKIPKPTETRVPPATPGQKVPPGGPIPPPTKPEIEIEAPLASPPYFVPPGEEL